MEKGKSYRRIGAVKITVAIIRHLADQRRPVSGQEVSESLGIPHATVMCHLATLSDEGLIREVGGAVEPGMGLALFWARYRSIAEGKIETLKQQLKELEITENGND